MLPSIRLYPSPRGRVLEKNQNASFKLFEGKQDDLDVSNRDRSLLGADKNLTPYRNNFQTPSSASTKAEKRRNGNRENPNINVATPLKFEPRSPLQSPKQANNTPSTNKSDLKHANNTPSINKPRTPGSNITFRYPSAKRDQLLSSRILNRDLPSPGKLLQRSFHGQSRSPRDAKAKQNRFPSNSSLCRSLFGKGFESPTSDGCNLKLEGRTYDGLKKSECIDAARGNNSGLRSKNIEAKGKEETSSDGLEKPRLWSLDSPFGDSSGRPRSPSKGNKALLNDAFIESISLVFPPEEDDDLSIESSNRKGKSGGSQNGGCGGGKSSGVLTSSPQCVVKPLEVALSNSGDGSANSVISRS